LFCKNLAEKQHSIHIENLQGKATFCEDWINIHFYCSTNQ